MNTTSVTAIYFSPTGNSKKVALAVAGALSAEPVSEDTTINFYRMGRTAFTAEDAVVFGAPVYGGRIPAIAYQRLAQYHGDGTPCVLIVTYGNRDYDDALLELSDLAKKNGFVPAAAGAFVGRHTFGEVEVTRPDEKDLAEAAELGRRAGERIKAAGSADDFPALAIKGEHHEPLTETKGKFFPYASGKCIGCARCAQECPTGAIPSFMPHSPANPAKCISCFRCIRNCPTGARAVKGEAYEATAKRCTENFRPSRPNELIL